MQWVGLFAIVVGIMLLFATITSNAASAVAAVTAPQALIVRGG